MAIMVAAAFTKCIVNSSFRVRGRNCSIDEKFRVICSNLNPGSVVRMYARDLEDLSMLVTSRVKDTHVHICVDAQTGLGTGVPGSASSGIGTDRTGTHRAGKKGLLECFITKHLLTATNTFSNTDDRNTNIYPCNYHGCHEPQQIDYIPSPDHSLRSRTFDSSATASDQWGLTATITERYGKTLGQRHVRKPIGSTLRSTTPCARS